MQLYVAPTLPYLGVPKKYADPGGTVFTLENGDKRVVERRVKRTKKKSNQPRSATEVELFEVIARAEGTLFSVYSQTFYTHTSTSVGPGEIAIRHHYGMSLTPAGYNGIDIKDHEFEGLAFMMPGGLEIKALSNGKCKIKPGGKAGKLWMRTLTKMVDLDGDGLLFPGNQHFLRTNYRHQETWREALSDAVTKSLLNKLPVDIEAHLRDEMKASKILTDYPNIAAVWEKGFIVVPHSHYDIAWEFVSVSQGIPRYEVNRKYLETRALHALAALARKDTKMKKVGVVIGSFKPPHRGHFTLIDIASRENDEVKLYISLSDRANPGEVAVKGQTMERLWREHFEPLLPKNVTVEYTRPPASPVRKAYDFLGEENKNGSDDIFTLYGTHADLDNSFPTQNFEKYMDRLFANKQIRSEPISRGETVQVSGTDMRNWLHRGDRESFMENLPANVDGPAIWDALVADGTDLVPMPVPKRRKK